MTNNRRPDPGARAPVSVLLGRRVECVDHVGRDAAPRRHVVPVSASPFPDRGALLTVDRTTSASRTGTTAPATAHPTAGGHPLLQISAEFRGILRRKVN